MTRPSSASSCSTRRFAPTRRAWRAASAARSEPKLGFVERAILAALLRLALARDPEVRELLAQRVAAEPEQLRRLQLITAGVCEHEVEQRALDAGEHLLVEVVRGVAGGERGRGRGGGRVKERTRRGV